MNKIKNSNKNPKVSFGAIYVEQNIDLGRTAESRFPPKFSKRDELLLNEIAQLYPNQDCFIRRGYCNFPRLEFREKPSLKDVKDDIIDVLATEKKNADTNLYYKSLIAMRTDAKLEFTDTKFKEEYDKFVSSYK